MNSFLVKVTKVMFGLSLYSLGLYLSIQANVGLAPWEAFSIGVSSISTLSYGTVVVLTGLVILIIVVLLREKIGIGTVLNTILIGFMVDLFQSIKIVPLMSNFFVGMVMLLFGLTLISFGSYFYISPGLGCGPRDSLMVALCKRMPKVPVGAIRGVIEGTVLIIGWLLGAKVGFGTVIAVFGISFILQFTFKLMHFDVKSVEHESIVGTWHVRKLHIRKNE